MSQVLPILKRAERPLSVLEIHELVNASRPFTIGCVLEALELENMASREILGEKVLWRKFEET